MKYSKYPIEVLYEKEQSMIDSIEERPEIKALQDQFLANLPEVHFQF